MFGKSYLADLFANGTPVPVIEMDLVRLSILPHSAQSKEDRNTAYRAMHYTADRLLEVGVPKVVLVAPYRPPEHRQHVLELLHHRKALLFLVQFVVHPETAVRRFLLREEGHAAVDLTENGVREQANNYPYFAGGCMVDTSSMSATESLELIRRYVVQGEPVNVVEWARRAL